MIQDQLKNSIENLTLILAQTHQTMADFSSIRQVIIQKVSLQLKETTSPRIIILPELALCGYPLKDLCLDQDFIDHYNDHLKKLEDFFLGLSPNENILLLAGGLLYENQKIYNVIFSFECGKKSQAIYRKMLLPNYDIFDEKKYFTPGVHPGYLKWNDYHLGLQICEDLWGETKSDAENNPTTLLKKFCDKHSIVLDLIINISASPFTHLKFNQRCELAQKASTTLSGAIFCYVNVVGGEDELLFDGRSFIQNKESLLHLSPIFQESWDKLSLKNILKNKHIIPKPTKNDFVENTHSYFPELRPWTDQECEEVLAALSFGLQEYARKNGMNKFLIALSGGIDSGLVLAITALSLKPGQEIESIYMPGFFSQDLSFKLCTELVKNLNLKLNYLPIRFIHSVARNTFKDIFSQELTGLSDENIQARLRGLLLYTRSNQTGSLVINTSNKSELAVGYSTLYGDSVGALSLIGDLYKTQVYQLVHFIQKKYGAPFPSEMISRAPSAELRENQKDQDSLPPYEELDSILCHLLSGKFSTKNLKELGFQSETILKVKNLYYQSEYKRRQFPPILKVSEKSFGFGHRMPLCKNKFFYHIID